MRERFLKRKNIFFLFAGLFSCMACDKGDTTDTSSSSSHDKTLTVEWAKPSQAVTDGEDEKLAQLPLRDPFIVVMPPRPTDGKEIGNVEIAKKKKNLSAQKTISR